MVKPSRDRSRKKFSGNHQRSWLWGHHAVCETLTAGKWPVLELLVTQHAFVRSRQLLDAKVAEGLPLSFVTAERIAELCKASDHQGLLARLGPFPYAELEPLIQQLKSKLTDTAARSTPLVVLCDRLQDSFNLGAILRCCDGADVQAVIVGEQNQAEITSHVSRSSSGAVNYLPIVRVQNLVETALQLQSIGLQLLAADANATASLWDADLRRPSLLIIGSEAHGVDSNLLAACDQRLQIPMQGRVSSLNAAVASGIILYEIRRQQWAGVSP